MRLPSYTIVADICEGIADCIPVCPVECIHWAQGQTNRKGTKYVYIDAATCIDCGACLSVCPIEGAILDSWEPKLQRPPKAADAYRAYRSEWSSPSAREVAKRILEDRSGEALPILADALEEAGCNDAQLLAYCRQGKTCTGGAWVAELVLDR